MATANKLRILIASVDEHGKPVKGGRMLNHIAEVGDEQYAALAKGLMTLLQGDLDSLALVTERPVTFSK